jgi:hypothetical protein
MSMRVSAEVEGLSTPLTVTGSGNFNFARSEGEFISNVSGFPAAALRALHASSIRITELFTKGALYLESPLFAGKLPGGARWMKLDLAKVNKGAGLDAQSLISGQSNPAQVLEYLRGSGSVTKVGTEQVRGVASTHYRAKLDLAKAAEKTAGVNRAQLKATIEKLVSQAGGRTVPVDVWVDSHNLVRRMSMKLAESSTGHHAAINLQMELFNFGATPTVNPPAAGEVYDATQESLNALSSASG